MSKETLIKVIDTTPKDFKAFVKLADIEGKGTTLILQRYLCTHIETTIGRDECLALFKGLAEHFGFRTDSDGDEAERAPHTSIILVDGPKGCGKTKHAARIMKHFRADEYLEGDEFAALETLLRMIGKSKCVVVMTNRTGESLYQMRVKMRQAGLHVVSNHFNDVMARIQAECDHDWQRRPCPDIHQPDYLHCRKCDATKEL